jgi:flagellar FliL protein
MAEPDQVDETGEGSEGEGSGKGGLLGKVPIWVIILIASQFVVVGGIIGAFVFMSGSSKQEGLDLPPTVEEQRLNPARVRDVAELIGPQFNMDPFIVNLIDDGRGARYLKIEIQFELEAETVRPELEGRIAQIRDEVLLLLTSKRVTDVESPDGKRILRDEIFTRVNKVLVTGRIKRVYFTDFVIQ